MPVIEPPIPETLTPCEAAEKVFTVEDAKQIYQRLGKMSVYPAFRDLVSTMVEQQRKLELRNDSYLDALFLTEVMFNCSRRNLRIFCGPSVDGFLKVLREPFIGALKRIQNCGGFVKVIALSREVPPDFDEFKADFARTFEFKLGKALEKLRHFMVCDSKMARLEEPHEELTPDTPATAIRAKIYFNEPVQAQKLEHQFDYIWEFLAAKSEVSS